MLLALTIASALLAVAMSFVAWRASHAERLRSAARVDARSRRRSTPTGAVRSSSRSAKTGRNRSAPQSQSAGLLFISSAERGRVAPGAGPRHRRIRRDHGRGGGDRVHQRIAGCPTDVERRASIRGGRAILGRRAIERRRRFDEGTTRARHARSRTRRRRADGPRRHPQPDQRGGDGTPLGRCLGHRVRWTRGVERPRRRWSLRRCCPAGSRPLR